MVHHFCFASFLQTDNFLKSARKIALFDFDGTLTYKDSMFEFIVFYHGVRWFYAGMLFLSPFLILHKLGIVGAQTAKEKVLTFFFKDVSLNVFIKKSTEFSIARIPKIIRQSALNELRDLQSSGVEIFVVSASASLWIEPWCTQEKIQLIATELEIKNDAITGKIAGNNCNGAEKAERVKRILSNSDYKIVSAYGDSRGDKEMLSLAEKKYYKHFI